jgi:hypothetical protein
MLLTATSGMSTTPASPPSVADRLASVLRHFGLRHAHVAGGFMPNARHVPALLGWAPQARKFPLAEYEGAPWSDVIADRPHDVWPTMLDFLAQASEHAVLPATTIPETEGEVEGITYSVRGSGPPLLPLTLSLARSQWEPFN